MRVIDALPGAASTCNPLFVHSAAGLGKTHLLNAIAWRIREARPERKVLFITAERFMYHFINALRSRDVISFKDYFQSIDVLAHRRLPVSAGQVDAAGVLPHLQLARRFQAAGDRRRRRAAGPAREHRSAHALTADGRARRRHRGCPSTTCATASSKRAWPAPGGATRRWRSAPTWWSSSPTRSPGAAASWRARSTGSSPASSSPAPA